MERIDDILSVMIPISEERYQQSRRRFVKEYGYKKAEIQKGIGRTFSKVFHKAAVMQERGEKNAVCCISICSLCSSYIVGSYQYHISLYDQTYYLDRREVCIDYTPDYLIPYFQDDMDYLTGELKEEFIRVKNYEIEQVMLKHMEQYHYLVRDIFHNTIEVIRSLAEYRELKKTDHHMFLFGGYRDKNVILGSRHEP